MISKRILILTNRVPYPLNDGGNLATKAMVEGYHNAGWQVYLLSMNTSRHFLDKDVLDEIYTDIYKFETVDVKNDIALIPVVLNFLFSKQPNHAERFQSKEYFAAIQKAITLFKPDIVQVESVFLSGYLQDIKRLTNATTILRLHNIEWQIWERLSAAEDNVIKRFYLNSLAKRIRKYEPKAWAGYDLLLPITDTDAEIVKQLLPDAKLKVVPFGVDTNKYREKGISQWEAYHLGAMDWLPNAEAISWFLQNAWPLIYKDHPEFKFSYAGRNMPAAFLNMNTPGATCFGEVSDAQEFIADKKILVVPLRSGGGIRVKILEAMAAGKIVVSTAIGMQGIDAISGIHYVQANTAHQFENAINWILANKDDAENIGLQAAALVADKYDIHTIQNMLITWLATHT